MSTFDGFLPSCRSTPAPPSFPTRRSSDLSNVQTHRANLTQFCHQLLIPISWQLHVKAAHAELERNFPKSSRSEEHTSELQSHHELVCRLLLEKKKTLGQISEYFVSLRTTG